jgi:hypothetical protein
MIYEARCNVCGKIHEYVRKAVDYLDTPECCGEKTEKVILTPVMGYCENIHYQSPITGLPITTKQQRIEDLKRSNSRPWEGMEQETKAAQQRAKEEEKQADAKLEEAVVGAWNQLAPEKRAALESA